MNHFFNIFFNFNITQEQEDRLQLHKINENSALQLARITVNEEYRQKWNISPNLNDFVVLTKNGELLRNTLYRIGGLNNPKLATDNYFMLLKHVEAFHSKEYLNDLKKSKYAPKKIEAKHLKSYWCILDKDGNEKLEFNNSISSPYLEKGDSCIYSVDGKYYNIETGEFYGSTSNAITSKDYLFLDNRYHNDKTKRGVMKINKKNGTWELFEGE